jgi:hypothetical protein
MTFTHLLVASSDPLPEAGLDSRSWQRDSSISIQFSDSFDAAVYWQVMSKSGNLRRVTTRDGVVVLI